MKKFAEKMYGLLAIVCAFGICGCDAAPAYNSALGFYLDTVITITGYADKATLENAVALCGEYEKVFSRTVEGSDVWRINHGEGSPVQVCGDTAELLAIALDICEKSGGALDITIAPASDLWDFKADEPEIPDSGELSSAAKLVDYTKLKLEGDMVTLPAGMAIDLGAVAKGYIADKAAEYLKEKGVESTILNLGGNVVALGSKPDGREWSIGIQDPEKENGKSGYSVMVADKSVVTSGIYQRGFDKDGVRYHHILDRATGWPVQNGLASVTIIADSSTMADAMSTACFVLGRDMGMSFAEEMGVQAVFIGTDGKVSCTPALKGKLEKTE